MLIIALVLAVIGLAALVFAVVTSNELVAWVCIGASVLGVVLLIIDALQERRRRDAGTAGPEPVAEAAFPHEDVPPYTGTEVAETEADFYVDYPEDAAEQAGGAGPGAPSAVPETATGAEGESGGSAGFPPSDPAFSEDPNGR